MVCKVMYESNALQVELVKYLNVQMSAMQAEKNIFNGTKYLLNNDFGDMVTQSQVHEHTSSSKK